MNNHHNGADWIVIYSFGIYFILAKKAFYYYKNLFDKCFQMITDIEEEDVCYMKGLLSN